MVLRAGIHGTVGQSSAQVIDGSLKFDSSATNYLEKTPTVAGNRKTFTISFWVKRSEGSASEPGILSTYDGVSGPAFTCYFSAADKLRVYNDPYTSGYTLNLITTQLFRDYNGWYNIVISIDTTQTTASDKAKLYVNGVRVTEFDTEVYPSTQYEDLDWNTATAHNIGRHANAYDGNISNFYSIDGQQLGPENFGFTDPLTNTWRPKKYEGTFGTNGYWLPFDGNSLIGQDKSGNGNDWTPVNFGGSNTIEKATGAFPIFNTVNGGNVATVGVRTDASVGVGTCVLALPLSNNATDVSNQIDGRSSQKSPSVTGAGFATTESNFYGSSAYFSGPTNGNDTATSYITVPDSNGDFVIGTGDYTMEAWVWGNDWTPGTANEEQGIMGHDGAPASEWNGFWSAAGKFGFYNAGSFVPSATPTDTRPTLVNKKWYHMAATRESGTVRCFLDGVLLGSQSSDTTNIATGTFSVGIKEPGAGNQFNGYIQDARLYVGVAKYTESFIPTSTNPDILPETPSGVSGSSKLTKSTDGTDINTVRGQETSYCTLNPLNSHTTFTLSNGNLEYSQTTGGVSVGTIGVSSGKWYWEYIPTSSYSLPGLYQSGDLGMNYLGTSGVTLGFTGGAFADASGGPARVSNITFTIGDIIGFVLDMDAGTLTIYKNGIASSLVFSNLTGTWFPAHGANAASTGIFNFGQKPFKYTPPDGFQPLNAANIRPETVITRPDQYVGVTTYTGNAPPGSANTQSFNIGFKPDLLWFKVRSYGSNHFLIDSVRTRDHVLFSNNVNNESTCDVGKDLVSFDHNGFTVGEGNQTGANEDGEDIVAWAWKAGGNKNTFNVDDVGYATAAAAGITGLDGTNQMTTANYLGCSIGTKQGFSIINYRGLGGTNDVAIPHGLSQSPDLVMIKNRNSSVDWAVAHSGLVDNRELHLNTNEDSVSVAFLGLYKSNFTSTSFAVNYGVSNLQYVNASNELYIAYVWHNVPGLQKFGSYKSNNSADGPYIELGFRPAIILIKCTSGAESWVIYDSERVPYNYNGLYLKAEDGVAEPSSNTEGYSIDFLSNGFKIRGQWGAINDTNTTDHYIYAAWAEAPAVNLYGGQSNAR